MSTLQEKEIVVKFKVAGYDLDTMDYRVLHSKIWLCVGDALKIEGCLMGSFELIINDKKVKS